jgi:hypothetical protein
MISLVMKSVFVLSKKKQEKKSENTWLKLILIPEMVTIKMAFSMDS